MILRDRPTNWGGGVWLYNGIPFTGIEYEYFPNTTQLSSESEYKDGIFDGRQVEYWPNGNLTKELKDEDDEYMRLVKTFDLLD